MPTVVSGDFEWDAQKASVNKDKHGVAFEEAVTAFFDERALVIADPHDREERFILLGMSSEARILYVVHAERVVHFLRRGEHTVPPRTRIISARVAHKTEAVQYALGDAT